MESEVSEEDKEKEKKRSGAPLPWLAQPGAGGQFALNWSSPGSLLSSLWRAIAFSPQAGLLRVALGAFLAVNAVLLGAWLVLSSDETVRSGSSPFSVDAPTGAGGGSGGIGRPSVESLIKGLSVVMSPDANLKDSEGSDEKGADDGDVGSSGEDGAAGAANAANAAMAGMGDDADKEKDGAGGTPSWAKLGSTYAGGAKTGASLTVASLPNSGSGKSGAGAGGAGAGGAGGQASGMKRTMSSIGAGKKGSRGGGKGALGQLKFADKSSAAGKASGSGERAYSAADTAFSGAGSKGGAGESIGGAGSGDPGGGIGPSGGVDTGGRTIETTHGGFDCPSGYILNGTTCDPIEGGNKTPWQGLVDKARKFLIAAAIFAAIGIALLFAGGLGQFFAGIMFGLAAGMVVAAMVMGNQIGDKYGQKMQEEVIQDAGDKAMKGEKPAPNTSWDGR